MYVTTVSELPEIRPARRLLLQVHARWSYVGGDQQGRVESTADCAVWPAKFLSIVFGNRRSPRIHGPRNALHPAPEVDQSTLPQASSSQRKLQGLWILAHDMCAQPPVFPQSLPPPPPHFGQLRGPKQSRRATCPALKTRPEDSMRLFGIQVMRACTCCSSSY